MPSLTILKDLTSGNTGGSDPSLARWPRSATRSLHPDLYPDGRSGRDAVITDPIKPGLKYLPGSASNGGVLVGADTNGNGGTVTWTFPTLSSSGTVTYQVLVLAAAVNQTQPIVNVATIDSNETPPDDDDATVGVNPPPSVASPHRPCLAPTPPVRMVAPAAAPAWR